MALQLLMLSCTSSLDNFVVGITLGMNGELPLQLNVVVSSANSFGALASTKVGALLGGAAPSFAGALAGSIFLYLAAQEAFGFYTGEESQLAGLALKGSAWKLALPMTLNNVAGGVAGGLTGFSPLAMGAAAWAASFGLMALGHRTGRLGKNASALDPRLIACAAFATLGFQQLADAVGGGGR